MVKRYYAKYYKNNPSKIILLSEIEAYDTVKSYTMDPRRRMQECSLKNSIKCGIWIIWGWNRQPKK